MARYRVQGPDGKIHVFEGPDGATPADVEAFAAATFGGGMPAATPQQPPAEEQPGVLQSALIGAGRTFDRVGKGMQQLYYGATGDQQALDQLKRQAEGDDQVYGRLQAARPIATAIGEAAPSMVIPAGGGANLVGTVARLAAAGAVPGSLEYGSAGERLGRAAGGAAAAVTGGVVVPKLATAAVNAVPAIGRTARAIVEPLTANGREAIVGRTLNKAASDSPAVASRLQSAAPLVPGSLPTSAQVGESGGLAALERAVSARAPEEFTKRSMDQAAARMAALRGIAGDDATMAAALATRKTVTGPLYRQAAAQTVAATDPALLGLLQRPSVQKAIARAQGIAAEEGRPFGLDLGAAPAKIDGRTLQDIKMGLDALLKDPTSGIAGHEVELLKQTRGQLMNWMENAIPELRVARQAYSDLSKPVNQMQIGQRLVEKLQPALSDHGALARETGNQYALALRNADQTARQATGFKGPGMADVMTPAQMDTLQAVAQDLARKANAQDLGRGVGSNTFQNFAMDNLAAASGAPRVMGGALNLPGVSKVAKFLYGGPEEQIQTRLAQALLEPQQAARLMGAHPSLPAPMNPQQFLFANPGRAAQLGGGLSGLAAAKLFAQ